MPTGISNLGLLDRCKDFIQKDPSLEGLDSLIKEAIITAELEIRRVDMVPLAWLRGSYDELFSRVYATISAITQADPAVITAESADSDVTGHGFEDDDIVYVTGIGDMEKLNNRYFRVSLTEKVTDGSFADIAANWTSGAGWTLNVAAASGADLEQDVSAVSGTQYKVVFTVSVTSGSLTPQVGGVDGDAITASGKHTQYITATGTGNLKFQGTAFTGTVSFASVTDADTLSFSQINDQTTVDTASYEEYDSGGTIYHAGMKIDADGLFEPSGTASYAWVLGEIFNASFDLESAEPIAEEFVLGNQGWRTDAQKPAGFQHKKYYYDDPTSVTHFLMFRPPAGQRYNIRIDFEKDYPSISVWDGNTYPPHPNEVHDYIWHRALNLLATNAEKARRLSKDGVDNTKIEVLQAQHWAIKKVEDTQKIIALNRRMLGSRPNIHSGCSA